VYQETKLADKKNCAVWKTGLKLRLGNFVNKKLRRMVLHNMLVLEQCERLSMAAWSVAPTFS